MKGRSLIRYVSAAAVAFFAFSVAAPAQSPQLSLFNGLQKGSWTLKARGSNGLTKKVCLGDPKALLQIQHDNANCTRNVLEDKPGKLYVYYACNGRGYGSTTIRRESSGLLQIHSEGIADNAPFNVSFEARRTGSC